MLIDRGTDGRSLGCTFEYAKGTDPQLAPFLGKGALANPFQLEVFNDFLEFEIDAVVSARHIQRKFDSVGNAQFVKDLE